MLLRIIYFREIWGIKIWESSPAFCRGRSTTELAEEYHLARSALMNYSPCVIVCDLLGMNLGMYNANGASYDQEQAILNAAVLRINEYIGMMNEEMGLFGPH